MSDKKWILKCCLLIVFVATLLLVLAIGSWETEGKTITVDDDGEENYETIREAVDAAEEGDTIRVWEGVYEENVILNKTLNLIGNGSDVTTIDGGGNGGVLNLEADWCNVSGFGVTNGDDYGIYLSGDHTTLSNNTISSNNYHGIYIFTYSSNNMLSRNTISGNFGDGVYLVGSDQIVLSNNTISGNDVGICLDSSSINNTAHYNDIFNNTNYGIDASDNDDYHINATNNFWGDLTGPYHPSKNRYGSGDNASDYVDFDPWIGYKIGPVCNTNKDVYYDGIQEAIDNATAGETIRIDGGSFFENIVINKPLTLIGNGTDETIVLGRAPDAPANESLTFAPVVTIAANDVVLEGLEVRGFGYILNTEKMYVVWDIGIAVVGNDSSISNVKLTTHSCGIFAGLVEMNLYTGDFGSWMGGKGLTVENCSFSQMQADPAYHIFFADTAITFFGMEDTVFSDNKLSGCHVKLMGAGNHTMENNIMDDGQLLYIRDVDTQPVIPGDTRQLIVETSSNVVVEDRELRYGVQVFSSSDITIKNVEIDTMDTCVDIAGSTGIELRDSTLASSWQAITVRVSHSISISGNTVDAVAGMTAAMVGISLSNTKDSLVENNEVSDFEDEGIILEEGSHRNAVTGNTVSMAQRGIGLREDIKGCVIRDNRVVDCNTGVELDVDCNQVIIQDNEIESCNYEGIDIAEGCHHVFITGNTIYHCRDGITVSGEVHSFLFSENEITGDEQSVGIEMNRCENVTFLNNTIQGFSDIFSNGMSVRTGKDLYFSGNHISTCDGGISLEGVESVEITGETIEDNYLTAVSIKNSNDVTVHNSWLEDNYQGFFVQDSEDILIHHCDISDNEDAGGLRSSSSTVDARDNYWGEYSGPYHSTDNTEGEGNKVEGDTIQFRPWLKSTFTNRHPHATIDSISPNPAERSVEITFTGSGEDDGDIKRYVWWSSIDGELYNGTETGFSTSSLSRGTHEITLRVQDNHDIWSEPVTAILVVNGRPRAEIISIPPDFTIKGTLVSFQGKGTDDGTIIRYVWTSGLDGELHNDTTPNFSTAILSNGTHEISFKVQDDQGVWSEPATTTLTIHGKPTAVIVSISPNPALDTDTINFEGNGTDDGTIESYNWRIRSKIDGEVYNGTTPPTILPVGKYTVYLKVLDNNGVWSDEVSERLIVHVKPTSAIVYISPNPSLASETVTFIGVRTDDGTIERYVWTSSIDNEIYNNTASSFMLSNLSTGTHTITLKVQDIYGTWSGEVSEILIVNKYATLDKPPTITSPTNGSEVKGTVTIKGTASDEDGTVEKVEISINGAEWVTVTGIGSWNYEWDSTTVENGDYEIRVRAYDGEDHSEETVWKVKVNNEEDGGDDGPGFEIVGAVLGILVVVWWRRKRKT